MDKRGHGLSALEPPSRTIAAHAADLAAVLDALAVRHALVVGLSIGGMIAQMLAASGPDLVGLLLLDTAHRVGTRERGTPHHRGSRWRHESIVDGVMERWFSDASRDRRPDVVAAWRTLFNRMPVEGYVAACEALREADLTAVSRSLRVPTRFACRHRGSAYAARPRARRRRPRPRSPLRGDRGRRRTCRRSSGRTSSPPSSMSRQGDRPWLTRANPLDADRRGRPPPRPRRRPCRSRRAQPQRLRRAVPGADHPLRLGHRCGAGPDLTPRERSLDHHRASRRARPSRGTRLAPARDAQHRRQRRRRARGAAACRRLCRRAGRQHRHPRSPSDVFAEIGRRTAGREAAMTPDRSSRRATSPASPPIVDRRLPLDARCAGRQRPLDRPPARAVGADRARSSGTTGSARSTPT